MSTSKNRHLWIARQGGIALVITAGGLLAASDIAVADEGGVSLWVPGFFGSLAATPSTPGFAFANVFIHPDVNAGGDVAFARQVSRGNITANFGGSLNANLSGRVDLYLAAPSYTFATPVFGGQAQVALAIPYGRSNGAVDTTLTGAVGPIGFSVSGGASDEITGFGDPAPMFSERWNSGLNNYMAYVTGNIPIGRYDPTRLANLGIGHNAIDAGGSYTYFNPQSGNEFSAVLGFTYNFENVHTQYQNAIDMHLDWGASHFLSKQVLVGVIGYAYQQLSCDSGAGDRVGCFESRVLGVGPQIGYIFPIATNLQGYLNLKGYREFDAAHRADGWNVWLTFAVSPAAPTQSTPPKRMLTK
jgi:hypothetical protein